MRACAAHLAVSTLVVAAIVLAPVVCHGQAPVPHSSHVVLVVEENTGYTTTLAYMPWLVGQGTANGHTTNYISDTSGSLMDYLWLASGSCEAAINCALPPGTHDFGCSGDSCAAPVTDDNIFREMNNLGISWKVYAQSYAAAGGTVTTPDLANGTHYYRRHNGATWYSDVLSNVVGSQAKIVDFSQFAADLANDALPQFSIIAPDGLNDGHDGTPSQADAFLKANLPALLAKSYFQPGGDGLLMITFDNGDFDAAGLVYSALIGPNVTPQHISTTSYKHENLFRTVLDALSINAHPGASTTASPMTDFFSGYVSVASPATNAVTGTQVPVSASAIETAAQIYMIQVWDAITGQKLAESAPLSSTFQQTLTLSPGTHRLAIEDISSGNFQVLHQALVTVTVQSDGVTLISPTPNATSGPEVMVSASAMESGTQIYQLQVWDNTTGRKLGESAPGTSTIQQSFTLASGPHQIIVEDIAAGTYQVLHQASANITVVADGVTISAPLPNSTTGQQVEVKATASESAASIYQLQIWDATTGIKLGQSAAGTSTIDLTVTLKPGSHQLIIEDISTGTYQVLHKASVTINVN
jgi:phosphatidylinositol-3-phosphatase